MHLFLIEERLLLLLLPIPLSSIWITRGRLLLKEKVEEEEDVVTVGADLVEDQIMGLLYRAFFTRVLLLSIPSPISTVIFTVSIRNANVMSFLVPVEQAGTGFLLKK